MIKPNEYVVRLLGISANRGRWYNNSRHEWVPINEAESYTDAFVKKEFTLGRMHELLKVNADGTLTHIR